MTGLGHSVTNSAKMKVFIGLLLLFAIVHAQKQQNYPKEDEPKLVEEAELRRDGQTFKKPFGPYRGYPRRNDPGNVENYTPGIPAYDYLPY